MAELNLDALQDEALTAAIEKLDRVYGTEAIFLMELLESVRDDGVVHAGYHTEKRVRDCEGCVTESIAIAVVTALGGGEQS